jgi:hypothetical protein
MNGYTATAIGISAFSVYAAINSIARAWADRATCSKCKADTAEK